MNCDIIFNIGGKDLEEFTIKREDSQQQLSSLNDIVEYIFNNWNKQDESKGQRLLDYLRTSTRTVIDNNNFFKNRAIIGNSSVTSLQYKYPSIETILKHIPEEEIYKRDYIVTLIDEAYISGSAFRGRTAAFGVITHVIRNQYDAEKFAKTILLTYLAEKKIKDGEIQDEYLKNKYQDKLKNILTESRIKSIKKHLSDEIKNFDADNYKVNILDLVLDYLNYKASYESSKVKQDDNTYLNTQATLQDFCRELQGFNIVNEDSETDLARKMRILDYKRENFGKQELYDAIKTFGTEQQKNILNTISEQDFISMNVEDMNSLIKELFKDDVILSRYSVKSVDTTQQQLQDLTKDQITTLIKNKKDKSDKRKISDILKSFSTIEEVQGFFGENLVITLDGIDYKVVLNEVNGAVKFQYFGKKITNNDKIVLQRNRNLLIDEYDFDDTIVGYADTEAMFVPVNREEVVDGQYKGYYIYQNDKGNGVTEYIISQSVFHPNLFNPTKVASLRDAKLAVDNFIRTTKIKNATNIELKKYLGSESKNIDPEKRSVSVDSKVFTGQTLPSIQYIIGKNVKLPPQEYFLYENKTMDEVQQYYLQEFGIDISALNTPEKIGIFLYALVENGITIGDVLQKMQVYSEYEDKDPVTGKPRTRLKLQQVNVNEEISSKVNNIINDINSTPTQNFLVERWYESEQKYKDGEVENKQVTVVYLRSLKGITINSVGKTPEGNLPEYSLVTALESLKDYLNNKLFNDNETVKIISKEELTTSEEFKGLFSDNDIINTIKAFVHNNNVYLIRGNSSIHDLIHEIFHILFASIKANDFNLYEKIINQLYEKSPENYITFVENNYNNFAQIDKMEEVVVRSLARQVENNTTFFFNNYNTQDNNILTEIAQTFRQLDNDIKKKLNIKINRKAKDSLDFEVPGKILAMSDSDKKIRMRQLTNLIKKGIKNNEIIEDCE